ncbi:MAG: hypothetical protein ABEN55_15130 [Bradymonadaceae bacterium]
MPVADAVPQPVLVSHKSVMLGTALAVLAVALDLRLLWMAVPFVCIAPLQLLFPGFVLELAAAGVLVGTALLARAWWPSENEAAELGGWSASCSSGRSSWSTGPTSFGCAWE